MDFMVIGGMLAASFIAAFLIPVVFYLVERFMGKKKEAIEAPAASIAHGELEPTPALAI